MVAAGRYPGLVDLTLHFPAAPVLDQRGQLDGLSREWLADLALHGRSPSTAQVAALMGISMIRAEDLHRATNPHRRRASDALRRLIDRTPE